MDPDPPIEVTTMTNDLLTKLKTAADIKAEVDDRDLVRVAAEAEPDARSGSTAPLRWRSRPGTLTPPACGGSA
jgi:hypothetical protein